METLQGTQASKKHNFNVYQSWFFLGPKYHPKLLEIVQVKEKCQCNIVTAVDYKTNHMDLADLFAQIYDILKYIFKESSFQISYHKSSSHSIIIS